MSAATPRAPARSWKVARHYLGMLGSGGGTWGVAAGLVHALTGTMDGNESIAFRGVRTAAMLAFFLPLLHWRSSGHPGALDGAMPLGRARHDLIRIACGAVWACAAVLAVVGFFMLLSMHLGGAPAAPPLRAGRRGTAGERRPAPPGVVFARDVHLLRPRMVWPLCLLALWLCVKVSVTLDSSTTAEPAVFDPWGFSLLSMLAFLPLLLWRDGTGSRLLYDDSLPVDGAKLRTMRVAAGAVWVGAVALAAVLVLTAGGIAAGRVPSLQSVTPRVWVGVPGAALLLYLLGSVPVLVSSRHPLLATATFWLSFEGLARLDVLSAWDVGRLSPWAALSPVGRTSGPEVPWQTPLAIWLPLAALAVAGAAALGASIDRTSQNPHADPVRTAPMAAGGAA